MRRRVRQSLIALAVLAMLLTAAVAPASAAPPQREEIDVFTITLDVEHGLVVFWNITRDNFCAWESSGFEGPPPVESLMRAQFVETGKGAVVVLARGTSVLELWTLDEGADLSGPCQDTDEQAGPWAVGSARSILNDNDLDVSGSRTNSFGQRIVGTVSETANGSVWRFSWTVRLSIDRDGEFRLVAENFTLAGR